MTDSPIMDLPEVAAYLKCHPTTIYRLLAKDKLPAWKIGRSWRFNLEHIEQWCKAQERDGTTSR